MIDNVEKAVTLMQKMEAALPIGAELTARAHKALRELSPDLAFPRRCQIAAVNYAGDEGGIVCTLDFGVPETGKAHIISITHLIFGRRNPLSRDIEAYRKHRVRRLRQLDGRRF